MMYAVLVASPHCLVYAAKNDPVSSCGHDQRYLLLASRCPVSMMKDWAHLPMQEHMPAMHISTRKEDIVLRSLLLFPA